MKIRLNFRNETKSCYRFEKREDSGDLVTLYLKKKDVQAASIDPKKGIEVTIKEAE